MRAKEKENTQTWMVKNSYRSKSHQIFVAEDNELIKTDLNNKSQEIDEDYNNEEENQHYENRNEPQEIETVI